MAAPCSTDRAGGGRAWAAGREKRSRRPRDAVVRVPCFPTGTSGRRAGPQSSASWSRRFSRGSVGRRDRPAPSNGGSRCDGWGGGQWGRTRGEDRSSKIRNGPLRGAILGVLAMLSCHALAGSARWWVVAAPCSTDRAGGGRAWAAGARETEPSSARRGRAGPVLPGGDVKPSGGPAEQRVLESAL